MEIALSILEVVFSALTVVLLTCLLLQRRY